MTATLFVDTNVLVYARDASDPRRQERAFAWMAALWEHRAGRLSHQVLQEYYVTVTRKLDPPRSVDDAREDVVALASWRPETTDLALMDAAWGVQDRWGVSWWDALIVAAAQRAGAAWLLTEDLQHDQDLDGVRVLDPFRVAPEEILGV